MATASSIGCYRGVKDDTFTTIRIRHPTDRGGGGAPAGAECRSRAQSANAQTLGERRVNVYRRNPPPTINCEPSTTDKNHHLLSTSSIEHNHHNRLNSESDESVSSTSTSFKRLNLFQRSFQNKCGVVGGESSNPSTVLNETNLKPSYGSHSPKQHYSNNHNSIVESPRSPFKLHLLDLFRNRSNSEGGAKQQRSAGKTPPGAAGADGVKNGVDNAASIVQARLKVARRLDPLFIDTTTTTAANSRPSLYSLKSASANSEEDDEFRKSPVMRKRSNSDNYGDFSILRKTSRPGDIEVLGRLTPNSRDDAYAQLLKTFTCYHLMPSQSAVIAIDGLVKAKQAFCTMVNNGVRAAVLWDSGQQAAVGMVSVTDLLYSFYRRCNENVCAEFLDSTLIHCLQDCDCSPTSPNSSSHSPPFSSDAFQTAARRHYGCKRKRPCSFVTIGARADLNSALTVLRLNKIHRLPVTDEETGNVLHFLTTKKILHFMYRQVINTSLPHPLRMYQTLDQLFLTGKQNVEQQQYVTIGRRASLAEAAQKLLDNCLSSLPVINDETQVVEDVFTKVDIMNFVYENGWTDLTQRTIDDALTARYPCMEKMVSCHKKTPLILAVDRLIRENAHRIVITDSNGRLSGVVSIGSLLSVLAA